VNNSHVLIQYAKCCKSYRSDQT